jgi:predicted ATPase
MLLANYSSWYRYLSRDQAFVFELTNLLRGVIPDFDVFKFESVSENVYFLKVTFRSKEGGTPISYSLRELSDGQRALIALYTLLLSSKNQHNTICLDEPENFLALPEIQPWLIQLYDQCIESNSQAILISHHPEMIDYLLASPVGYWFERPNNLAVRVKSISADGQDGLPVSELIARGWLHG